MALYLVTCLKRQPGPFAGQLRVCDHPDCPTLLNQYHEGPFCFTHEAEHDEQPEELARAA